MRRIMLPALAAGLLALSVGMAFADEAKAPAAKESGAKEAKAKAFVSAVGEYRWNPETSKYSTPVYAKEQTMSIKRDGPDGVTVSQDVTLMDGKKLTWGYDGPYDGKRQQREWMSFAFKRIGPDRWQNDYDMNDGTKGHEVATITKDHVTIRGASWGKDGKKHPYTEVWDKVS